MEFNVHQQVLAAVFAIAVVLGAIVNKTNFCTMGAVSDWINIGDSGRMRAWLFAIAIAMAGVAAMESAGIVNLAGETFPPYRSANFSWLRYLAGGAMFGIGMTLASGCGNKTLVRVGAGNLKSLVVLVIASLMAYLMMWTPFYEKAFHPWVSATAIDLARHGMNTQQLGTVLSGLSGLPPSPLLNAALGGALALGLFIYVFRSADFRGSLDNILGGAAVGLAVLAGWYLTGGPPGQAWKEYAEFASQVPSRVQVQSYTFISPMGDSVRYLLSPDNTALINFGVMALSGVIAGSFIYALITKSFRVEWFVSFKDFANHAVGGVLMGVGGVLAMGCTVGQAITGMSTLALGSLLTFFAIVIGAAATMKYQYWRMMQEA
ncbi:MAG: YeeE/YedE family protein [Burkholderiales bacterium]|nr:YeeE/YedE family protein [Burkholderiales bacterium]